MAAIGSTSIATESGVSTPTIFYLNMPIANNEYSYTFPQSTRELFFVNWNGGLVEYSYTSGGDTMPLNYKEAREKTKLILNGTLTIYFKCTNANGLVKIEHWS